MTLNKTDRIVITLGKQIVHGNTYLAHHRLRRSFSEEFANSRNSSSVGGVPFADGEAAD